MRMLLIDAEALFRHGLRLILSDLDSIKEIIEADTVFSAAREVHESVDLILLDLRLTTTVGSAATHLGSTGKSTATSEPVRAARQAFPKAIVVVLSAEEDPTLVFDAIDAGAAGFIPKSSTAAVLISALRLILVGGVYLPRHVLDYRPAAHRPYSALLNPTPRAETSTSAAGDVMVSGFFLADESGDTPSSGTTASQLTRRQQQVLKLVVQGLSNKAIARELNVSESTIKQHLSSSFKLLGVNNRTQAVYLAAQLGLHPNPTEAGRGAGDHGPRRQEPPNDDLSP